MAQTALQDRDFEPYRLTHRAMNREVDAIATMVAEMPAQDRKTPRRLHEWLRFVERTLHHHHTAEDRFFFPALAEKSPDFHAVLAQLDAELAVLDPLMRRTMDGLAALAEAPQRTWEAVRAQVRADAEEFRTLLRQHLAHEEAEVVERARQSLSRMDIDIFNRKAFARVPVGDMRTILPWMLDACGPDERARMYARLTLTSRVLYRLFWGPRYRKMRALHVA